MPSRKSNQPMLFKEMESDRDRAANEADGGARLRYDMFVAIGEACGINLEGATRVGCGVVWKAADSLIEVGGTPADVEARMKVIAARGEKFNTIGCLVKYWSQAQPKLTVQPGSPAKPDDYDPAALEADRVARADRVHLLPVDQYNELRERVVADAVPPLRSAMESNVHLLNYMICEILDTAT